MHDDTTPRAARPSRRTVATGLAWSVPVITVGAAAPAMAASAGIASITAACYPEAFDGATFTLSVTDSSAPAVEVLLTHTGAGAFSATAPVGWGAGVFQGNTVTYTVPLVAGSASGEVVVNFLLDIGESATMTAQVSAPTGFVLSGTLTAQVDKQRFAEAGYECGTGGPGD